MFDRIYKWKKFLRRNDLKTKFIKIEYRILFTCNDWI